MDDSIVEVVPLNDSLVIPLANYWSNLKDKDLIQMGVDKSKLPNKDEFTEAIKHQISLTVEEKKAFALIAMLNGKPIGHCNLNPIQFGLTAKMHMHVWSKNNRKRGLGLRMVQQSIPVFFDTFQLNEIICEPMASNPGPNKTLALLGFGFIKSYISTPGEINYEQKVNRWRLTSIAASNIAKPPY